MADNLEWSKDPLVKLENAVLPVLGLGQSMICNALALGEVSDRSAQFGIFDTAIRMLQKDATEMLMARDIRADPIALLPLKTAAKAVEDVCTALQTALFGPLTPAYAMSLLAQITDKMVPAINDALDAYRKIFIGHVIAQQFAHAKQAQEAIGRLDKISKQIFFISINASVEAARVGDAGRGFTQISSDIRALSQSAQDATRNLSDLVQDG
ncbi:MAG: methyl-accepting chemotaxis protein [Sulfitobacter sp.]